MWETREVGTVFLMACEKMNQLLIFSDDRKMPCLGCTALVGNSARLISNLTVGPSGCDFPVPYETVMDSICTSGQFDQPLLAAYRIIWYWRLLVYGACHGKTCLRAYADSKSQDQPAHLCTIIRVFTVCNRIIGRYRMYQWRANALMRLHMCVEVLGPSQPNGECGQFLLGRLHPPSG